ncbi:MAG: Planctomycete cytochrome, partial [Verrucomicrobiales bacterium]|nr:Planctomycete cytochrome [Verrucomicrobiales bacterium]
MALAFLILLAFAGFASAAEAPDFLREVRPILSSHCFKCHGPDESARKGKLRLDDREAALKGGKSGEKAITPGKPDSSAIIARVFTKDEDELMPPTKIKHPLTLEQKEILKRWVLAGAEYKPHWAFIPPRQTEPPRLDGGTFKIRNAIDAFVLERLRKEGLSPSVEADRYTLCRRVYLDLIGLPPSIEESDAFINDPHPDAYERLVDELLASEHYGERWARRWLDLARYADTNGYEKDRNRNIWPYRDWVIRALNSDMPFDKFTIAQIAGDMLPRPSLDDLIATGFHRNTMLNEEGGIDPLEFRYNAVVDRVNTTGTAWLGLTVGCAQCHTHKYDPILHQEYYQLMAFLDNADEPDLDLPPADAREQQQRREQRATKLLADLEDKWPVKEENLQWEIVKLNGSNVTTGNPADKWKILHDGSILFSAPGPDQNVTFVSFDTTSTNITSLRVEALTDDSLPSKGPGRTDHGNFVLTEINITNSLSDGSSTPEQVRIASASADAEQDGFPVKSAFDGQSDTGWAVHAKGKPLNQPRTAIFELAKPIGAKSGSHITIRLEQTYGSRHTIGRLRLSVGIPAAQDDRPLLARRKAAMDKAFAAWLTKERKRTVQWQSLRPAEAKANLPLLTVQPDDSIFASGDTSKSDTYDLAFTNNLKAVTAIRLEALPDDRLPAHGPGMTYYEGPKGDFFLGEFQVKANSHPVKFAKASESYAKNNYGSGASAMAATDGDPQTGWTCAGRMGEAHTAVFIPDQPIDASRLDVRMLFGRHYACSLGRFRISVTTAPGEVEAREFSEQVQQLLLVPDPKLTAAQRQQLLEQFLLSAPELEEHAKKIRELRKPPAYSTTLVLHERPPENPRATFVHNRGEFLQPKDRVEPGIPSFLPSFPANAPKNRLSLAKWLVSPQNPLTARVVVNRHWAAFFGNGFVRTLNDFGFQGELPTHPELLDWMAVQYMKDGWSTKVLHRLIVTSSTYRQSSKVPAELEARDPNNRLFARGPRVRLEAELVRDGALHASGLLSRKMFGPPVRPPQPAGVTEVAYGSPAWETSTGEDRYRRSLYTFQKRSAPFAMFNTFDAPSGEVCLARRESSNTPLQALALLNDVAFVEVAR